LSAELAGESRSAMVSIGALGPNCAAEVACEPPSPRWHAAPLLAASHRHRLPVLCDRRRRALGAMLCSEPDAMPLQYALVLADEADEDLCVARREVAAVMLGCLGPDMALTPRVCWECSGGMNDSTEEEE
jgi:hypothetical protein